MDFELDEEQIALRETAREFLRDKRLSSSMRDALDRPPAQISGDLWREISEMGWVGAATDAELGGAGQDVLTAAVLAEEAGRALLPGPLLSAQVACIAIDRSSDAGVRKELLPDLASGRRRATIAIEEPGGSWGPDAVQLEAKACGGGEWSLTGTKILVPDAEAADLFLVAARTSEGAGLLRVPASAAGLTVTAMRRIDAQSIAELRFENVRVPSDGILGSSAGPFSLMREVVDVWTTLQAADLLGTAGAVLEATVAYASERIQFGRPIGSFQAVSHRLADILVDLEIARSLLYAACLAIDERRSDAGIFASAAKAWTSEAAVQAGEAALQIHGGVGFTWETDVHLHLRRARAGAATLGDAEFHLDRVAAHLDVVYAAESNSDYSKSRHEQMGVPING